MAHPERHKQRRHEERLEREPDHDVPGTMTACHEISPLLRRLPKRTGQSATHPSKMISRKLMGPGSVQRKSAANIMPIAT